MKRLLFFVICSTLYALTTQAQLKRIIFTPQWAAQSQFTGYYVAKEKGFFKEYGLDVIIHHNKVESKKAPVDVLCNNEAQVVTAQFLQMLKAQDQGIKVVNILQTSQNNSLMCVSPHKISSFKELNGKKIGTWINGFREVAELACKENKMKVKWIPITNCVNLFVNKAVDATLCFSYSEYLRLVMIRGDIPKENLIYFSDLGYNIPEDGVYTTEEYYNSHKSEMKQFANAVKKGWDYARKHKQEALEITQKYVKKQNIAISQLQLRLMLDEVLRLQEDADTKEVTYAPISPKVFNTVVSKMRNLGIIKNPIQYNSMFK
ncbi:MAG: ABC transporter substrate-binding protein [Prevotellaceae bacterium]|nr:ABC transporter substrate-binding protein [Candidatus Colivivens equi]MCQ2076680.1 ABC transporter substrate-binding protein [Bacteroidaceae bacterium]